MRRFQRTGDRVRTEPVGVPAPDAEHGGVGRDRPSRHCHQRGRRPRIGDWDVYALLDRFGYRCRRIATEPGRLLGPATGADETFSGYVNVLFQPPDA